MSHKMRSQRSRMLSHAEIIAELQRLAAVVGSTTHTQSDVGEHSEFSGRRCAARLVRGRCLVTCVRASIARLGLVANLSEYPFQLTDRSLRQRPR